MISSWRTPEWRKMWCVTRKAREFLSLHIPQGLPASEHTHENITTLSYLPSTGNRISSLKLRPKAYRAAEVKRILSPSTEDTCLLHISQYHGVRPLEAVFKTPLVNKFALHFGRMEVSHLKTRMQRSGYSNEGMSTPPTDSPDLILYLPEKQFTFDSRTFYATYCQLCHSWYSTNIRISWEPLNSNFHITSAMPTIVLIILSYFLDLFERMIDYKLIQDWKLTNILL